MDYIFGAGTVFFDKCHIHSLSNGYITAASTDRNITYGLVFSHCTIDGEKGVQTYLGRPWKEYASVYYVYNNMSNVVRHEGWFNWNHPEREKTSRYYEYGNSGLGASLSSRVNWSQVMTKQTADTLTPEHVLGFKP